MLYVHCQHRPPCILSPPQTHSQCSYSVWKSKEFCSGKCVETQYLDVLIIGNHAMLKMNGIIIKKIIHVVLLVDSLVSYSCPDPAKIKHTFL